MMNITPPPALHGDEQAKLTQIYRYLFRLSESLNATAATIDSQAVKASEAVAKAAGIDPATVSADVGGQYTALVSLVVKTANIVQSQMDKIVTTLNSKYKASGEFGELTEEVRREIEETAKHTIENFQYGAEVLNIPEMAADFEAYKIEAEGYIKRGIIDYDKDGFPVFGIAIGQELKSREVTIDGVVYTEFDTTKNMATYTAEKLSFWIDGVEVAYLSQSELVVTRIIVSDSIQLGDWDIKVNAQDGLTIQQRIGNEIVTASQINMVADQIDLSGNKSIKLTAEQINAVANEIDLSGNKSIKLTAEQINAVAGQIDLTSNKSITMLAGEVDNLDRLSNIEVIEGTFAQTERREGEGIRIYSEFGPKQDLKWGAPWPGGAGKNLLPNIISAHTHYGITFTPNDDGSITVNGTNTSANAAATCVLGNIDFEGGKTYSISGVSGYEPNTLQIWTQSTDAFPVGSRLQSYNGATTRTAAASEVCEVRIQVGVGVTINNVKVYPMLAEGSDATYAPYANTPPIEGWTGLNAFAGGKNLLPNVRDVTNTYNGITFTNHDDGSYTLDGTATAYAQFLDTETFVLPAGTYELFVENANAKQQVQIRSADGLTVLAYSPTGTFTLTEDTEVKYRHVVNAGVTVTGVRFYPMVHLVSDLDATYAPYQGNTYSLDFGEEVYGGTVDCHAGEMTVEWAFAKGVFKRVALDSTGKLYSVAGIPSTVKPYTTTTEESAPNIVCTALRFRALEDARKYGEVCITQYGTGIYIGGYVGREAELDALIASDDFAVAYKLAEPYTIQLTPVQIETLQGINTVYTDADGGRVEFGHSPIEDIQNAVDALEEAQAESALYLKLDAENKVVRIGQTEVTSEFDIDAYGAGVVVGGKVFSRFEGERVLIGDMEMRKPANIGGLAFDSIMT